MANNILNVRIELKYDTEANWSKNNPVLLVGEMAISSDKGFIYKIGDGAKKWSELKYLEVPWTNISGRPSTMKNPTSISIKLNGGGTEGTNLFTYDGSTAKTVNITPASIGASPTAGNTGLKQLASTVTLGTGEAATIEQGGGTYRQRISIIDNATAGDSVFEFLQSSDTGTNYKCLLAIRDDGNIIASKFTGDGSALTGLNAGNISSGTLNSGRLPTVPVSKGGTGATTLAAGQVLLGNGTNAVTTRAIDATNGGTSGSGSLITSGAVYAGLSTKSPSNHNHDSVYVNTSGDTMTGNLTVSSSAPIVTVKNTGNGDSILALDRASAAGWRMRNTSGNLKFECDWTSSKGTSFYEAFGVDYNTGNGHFKGDVSIGNGGCTLKFDSANKCVNFVFA